MDRTIFFRTTRTDLFGGTITQPQVDGLSVILDAAELRKTPLHQFAYILATTFHETNQTMVPVREAYWLSEDWRKKHLRYWPYYGRGFVQLTWRANYVKADLALGFRGAIVDEPSNVMIPSVAVTILFKGMEEGWFTGKTLDEAIDHIDESNEEDLREYREARKIINGTDRADKIAHYAVKFQRALELAGY